MNSNEAVPSESSVRLLRTVVAGAQIGALPLVCILLVLSLASEPISRWLTVEVLIGPLLFGAPYGALAGAIVGPLLRYTLLRNVPASRAIVWSVLAIVAGLVAGAAYGWYWMRGAAGLGGIEGAGIALFASSVILWWRHRPAARRPHQT